jgi:hypothetical protein
VLAAPAVLVDPVRAVLARADRVAVDRVAVDRVAADRAREAAVVVRRSA